MLSETPQLLLKGLSAATRVMMPLVLIFAAAFVLYWQSFSNALVFDSAIWFGEARLRVLESYGYTDRYLSKKLAYLLWRWSDGNVVTLHVVNTFLHGATACIGYLFFRRLFSALLVAPGSHLKYEPRLLAFTGALLFALHPVLVYAVAYVGQMEIILATLFALLFLVTYLDGILRHDPVRLVGAAALYWIALLSKEHVIMVPAVALAMTLLFRPPSLALLRELWVPFTVYGLVALHIFSLTDVGVGQIYEPSGEAALDRAATLGLTISAENAHGVSIITQALLFFRYWLIWLLPYPGWMSIDLQYPIAASYLEWPFLVGLIGFSLYPLVVGWLLLRGGRLGLIGLCLLYPWLMFFTEFVAVRVHEPFVLYRSYLWMIGACWAVPLIIAVWRIYPVLIFAILVSFGAAALDRLASFESPYKLWDDAVRKNDEFGDRALAAYRAYLNRGTALHEQGQLQEALQDYAKALELNPNLAQAHANRATALVQLEQLDAALIESNEAIRLGHRMSPPALASAHSNRAGIYLLLNHPEEALKDLEQAVVLDPEQARHQNSLKILRDKLVR
jgi:hypothetical protein